MFDRFFIKFYIIFISIFYNGGSEELPNLWQPLYYHIYPPVEPFVGRGDEFNSIKWLHLNDRFVAILGPRGIGKSELVKKYIEYYKQEYWPCNIIWINCENTASFVYDFKVLAFKLGIQEQKFQKLVERVLGIILKTKTFFVFDNVNEKALVPQITSYLIPYLSKIHVCLTSRQNLSNDLHFSSINLPPFTFDEVKYLVQLQLGYLEQHISNQDILELARLTEFNPELLIQSIDYIKDQNKFNCLFTIKDFVVVFNETNIPFLEEAYSLKEDQTQQGDQGINLFIIANGGNNDD